MRDEQTIIQGFLRAVSGHGLTGFRPRFVREIEETRGAPAHRVVSFSRVVGEAVEPSQLVLTVGLSQRPLASTGPGRIGRFELMTWVDDLALSSALPQGTDVLLALSMVGRSMLASPPGSPPWSLGDTIGLEDPIAGWRRFLVARATRPIDTELGPVDIARVVPIDEREAAELRARGDGLDGAAWVTALENQDLRAVLSRWRNPPAPPFQVIEPRALAYEGAGDTLRVLIDDAPWSTDTMRDATIALDAQGHLLALALTDDAGPRVMIAVGPPEARAGMAKTRVLQMKEGAIMITMGAKRVRGDVPSPYRPWKVLGT